MEEEKLSKIANDVCRGLTFHLIRAGLLRIECYVTVILCLFDYVFNVCSEGDKKGKIVLYEGLLELLNKHVENLKEKNENKREG